MSSALTSPSSDTAAALTASDRCDRCGARAKSLVVLATGGQLLFCGHHTRQHAEVLRQHAAAILAQP
jgi:hypothetical protein